MVTEEDPGGGTDACWFVGSKLNPLNSVTGSSWRVDSSNVWGSDYVGYNLTAVRYYRRQLRVPCSARFRQEMVIDCAYDPSDPTNLNYITNQLGSTITTTTVTSTRAGHTVTNTTWK